MRPHGIFRLLALMALLGWAPFSLHARDVGESGSGDGEATFFEDLVMTRGFTLGVPRSVRFTPDGKTLFFLQSGPRDPVLRLYELSVRNGKVRELLAPEELLGANDESLSVEEKARRERQRMTLKGFTFFQLSRDGSRLLVSLSGRLFVVSRRTGAVLELPSSDESWIDPKFSPDGRFVAAVQSGELFVIDLDTMEATQVTSGGNDTLTHGLAEFVAQEEMGRYSGYWWSPDSSRIAYEEADTSAVETLYIMSPRHPERPPTSFRYPRAGTPNATVRLGIVARAGGEPTWVDWDKERYPYLARVVWQEHGPLTLVVQTRSQQEEALLAVDDAGNTRELLVERDEAWVNLGPSTPAHPMPCWLEDGRGFLWHTERNGGWQIELRDPDGTLVRPLTPVGMNLAEVLDVDVRSGTLMAAGGPDPRESHLFRVAFTGEKPRQLTGEPGMHYAVFADNHKVYAHTFVLEDGRRGTWIRTARGRVKARLPYAAEAPPFLPRFEILQVGEERKFDAVVVRPRDFDPETRYPVILHVYGGPMHKMVTRNPYRYLRDQWMADHGYLVVSVDGRGTPGHGRDWERAIRGNLIDVVLEDQVAGLRALAEAFPEMDLDRVAVTGWSFGGYVAAMATIRRPDVFRAGIAGAPVTDWLDYDTHYTERYLGLPADNQDGYAASSVLSHAADLRRPLMLIHGVTDDNVYFVHTFKLLDALFSAGRPYDLVLLPGTHLLPDPVQRRNLWTRVMDYVDAHAGNVQ